MGNAEATDSISLKREDMVSHGTQKNQKRKQKVTFRCSPNLQKAAYRGIEKSANSYVSL